MCQSKSLADFGVVSVAEAGASATAVGTSDEPRRVVVWSKRACVAETVDFAAPGTARLAVTRDETRRATGRDTTEDRRVWQRGDTAVRDTAGEARVSDIITEGWVRMGLDADRVESAWGCVERR